jgi:hypothetical protein
MANDMPFWAAYCALKARRLVALDKCPNIWPVRIGESWNCLTAKCVLFVTSEQEAKETWGVDQLCAGLKAGIAGVIHVMCLLWETHSVEEEWGFLLVDAKNAFNEGNQTVMCWTVHHLWPSGDQFMLNCYRHWLTLVIRLANDTALFLLFSKEGTTQGKTISMVVFGLLLICDPFPKSSMPVLLVKMPVFMLVQHFCGCLVFLSGFFFVFFLSSFCGKSLLYNHRSFLQ